MYLVLFFLLLSFAFIKNVWLLTHIGLQLANCQIVANLLYAFFIIIPIPKKTKCNTLEPAVIVSMSFILSGCQGFQKNWLIAVRN